MTDPFPPGWRVVGASIPGLRQNAAGRANQDAWLYRPVAAGTFVLAVADGAGSRPRSAVGSRLAVEAAFAAAGAVLPATVPVQAQPWVEIAARWAVSTGAAFTLAAEGVAAALSVGRAPGSELEPADFATTLLAVLVHPPWYCYITVGDCFLVVGRQPGGPHLVVPPAAHGPRGVTAFLTSPDAGRLMSFGVIDEPRLFGLALCSDGLIEATLDTARLADGTLGYVCPSGFAGFFEVLADARRPADELAGRLMSPDYKAASGDDMTMVLAVRR